MQHRHVSWQEKHDIEGSCHAVAATKREACKNERNNHFIADLVVIRFQQIGQNGRPGGREAEHGPF